MRNIFLLCGGILLLLLVFFFISSRDNPSTIDDIPEEIKASTTPTPFEKRVARFAIYTNGTKRIFTDPRYHNRSSDVFIEESDPSQIHVQKANVTWNDFFDSLPSPMRVTKDCLTTGTGQVFCTENNMTLFFYLNDKNDPNALEKEIKNNDTLLISYSENSSNERENQVQLLLEDN